MAETERYLARGVDGRMLAVIERYLSGYDTIVDLACGTGLYGCALHGTGASVIGVDSDPALCEAARATQHYRTVVCADARDLGDHVTVTGAVFCSEFLEHVADDERRSLLDTVEARVGRRIVITVPNPLSPHFKHDPTHVAHYSVRSLLRELNMSHRFVYRLLPLGFSEIEMTRRRVLRLANPVAQRVAVLSPTVLYVGDRRL